MRLNLVKAGFISASALVAAQNESPELEPYSLFDNRAIYKAREGERLTYPRHVELESGELLVTASLWTNLTSPTYFPVFESEDGGVSWEWVSNITDQVNGWGMSAQPALMELTEPIGDYSAGTILASGNSWSENGTRIDVYASLDKGRSWEFVSRVTQGGRPNTTNGADPVWEPFLMLYDHQVVCYYSDQRDPLHGQKLAHQTSPDLKTWGPVVNDVAYDQYIARPGMTVVAKIETMDKYIVVYEYPIGNSSSHGANYPVHYRIASNPLLFDSAEDHPIVIGGNFAPNASPYVVWSPVGGPNGTIVVSDADYDEVYTNRFGGDPDKWVKNYSPQPGAYSRALHVFRNNTDHLMILGGSKFDGGPPDLTLSVVSITEMNANSTEGEPGPGCSA
ncbi:hypothetical protein MCOR25_007514 [Pyricularia grisea]|uniref:BNR/Asp-box repeat domain protein n=1 Tax=Pyricularia grisea TaxID=148305 RepID=A0A6P8BDZ5_PYRGI|nr:uncharacterized protein PgNI_04114 [Pyricularia grisea]KAI6357904.1 hypothetical protein MCOR25_007514 [Pyricularia grisea]TLD13969.1 hypothetical protein PgNI_04114 [Pyricularia grisea]